MGLLGKVNRRSTLLRVPALGRIVALRWRRVSLLLVWVAPLRRVALARRCAVALRRVGPLLRARWRVVSALLATCSLLCAVGGGRLSGRGIRHQQHSVKGASRWWQDKKQR